MKKGYDLFEYLKPVWNTSSITNETVMFLGEEDSAKLLYSPENIISVKNYSLDKTYVSGKDYIVENGAIKRLIGGDIPFFTPEEYYVSEPGQYSIGVNKENVPFNLGEGDKFLAYGEGDTFTRRQIAITYNTTEKWNGVIPIGKENRLLGFKEKLEKGEKIKIVFYGDSITTGCNSSGTPMGGNVPPYMDSYPEMITEYLQKKHNGNVQMENVSVGGWSTYDGYNNFDERVLPLVPDLLVLAFGMNDLFTPLDEYYKMTEEMVLKLKKVNPNAEIVLVATMWPHTESTWVQNQIKTLYELLKLENKYKFVAVADLTTLHGDILKIKRYRDMTANNINHPNDFMARVYGQVILQTVLGDKFN